MAYGKELSREIANSTDQDAQNKPPQSQKKLHNGLVEKGLYSKSYDEFRTQFSDSTSMAKLHKGLREQNLYSKDFDNFKSQFFPEVAWGEKSENGTTINDVLKSGADSLKRAGSDVDLQKIAKEANEKPPSPEEDDSTSQQDIGMDMDDVVSQGAGGGIEPAESDMTAQGRVADVDADEIDMEAIDKSQEISDTTNKLFDSAYNSVKEQIETDGESSDLSGANPSMVAGMLVDDLQNSIINSPDYGEKEKIRAREIVEELKSKRAELESASLEDYYENTTLSERSINAVKKGFFGMAMGFSARKAMSSEKLRIYGNIDNGGSGVTEPDSPSQFANIGEQAIAMKYRKADEEQRRILRQKAQSEVDEAHKRLVEYGLKMEKIPSSPSAKRFMMAEDTDAMFGAFKEDPVGVAIEVSLQSAPSILPMLVAGGGGAIAGSFAGSPQVGIATASVTGGFLSQQMEYGNKLIEALDSEGVDIQDEKALNKAVRDQELMDRAKEKAKASSSVVGLFDGLSMLIPGAYMTKTASKSLQKSVAKHVSKEVLEKTGMLNLQAVLGAGGEASSQMITYGEVKNIGAVGAEALGELTVSGPAELYTLSKINKTVNQRRLQGIVADVGINEHIIGRLNQERKKAVNTGNPVAIRDIDMIIDEIKSKEAEAIKGFDLQKMEEYRAKLVTRVRDLENSKGARVQEDRRWDDLTETIANLDQAIDIRRKNMDVESEGDVSTSGSKRGSKGAVEKPNRDVLPEQELNRLQEIRDNYDPETPSPVNSTYESDINIMAERLGIDTGLSPQEKLALIEDMVANPSLDNRPEVGSAGAVESVKGTTVSNENGEPIVVYQGRGKKGLQSIINNGEGWFSRYRGVAVQFADPELHANMPERDKVGKVPNRELKGEVYPAYLNIQNPKRVSIEDTQWNRDTEREFIAQAKEEGHDGLIITNKDGDRDYVVFEENQIVQVRESETQTSEPINVEGVFDEDGEPRDDVIDQAYELAREREINILSDKEPHSVVTDEEGNVIGATFISFTQDGEGGGKYGFDIVVSEDAEGRGIGSALVDDVKELPYDIEEAYPDATVEVDVVNPRMREILERKGFKVDAEIAGDRVIMVPDPDFNPESDSQSGQSFPERIAKAKNNTEVFDILQDSPYGKDSQTSEPIYAGGFLKNGKRVDGLVTEYSKTGVGNRKKPLVKISDGKTGRSYWVEPDDVESVRVGDTEMLQVEETQVHNEEVITDSYDDPSSKTESQSDTENDANNQAKDEARPNPSIQVARTEEQANQLYSQKKKAIMEDLWKEIDLDKLTDQQLASYVYSKMLESGMVANQNVIPSEYRGDAIKYAVNRMSTNEIIDYFNSNFGIDLRKDVLPVNEAQLKDMDSAINGLDMGVIPQSEVRFANEALNSIADRAKRRVESGEIKNGDNVVFRKGGSSLFGKVAKATPNSEGYSEVTMDNGAVMLVRKEEMAPFVKDDFEGVMSDRVIGNARETSPRRVKPKLPNTHKQIINASNRIVELQNEANNIRQAVAKNKVAIMNDPTLAPYEKAEQVKEQLRNRTNRLARISAQINQVEAEIGKVEDSMGKSALQDLMGGFGSENKIVTREEAKKAADAIVREMGQLNMGLSPRAIRESIKLGAFLIEGGVYEFRQFADILVRDMGPMVLPKLQEIYQKSSSKAGFSKTMTNEEDVDAYIKELTASSADYGLVRQANNDIDVPSLETASELILNRAQIDESVREDLQGAEFDTDEVNRRVRRNRIYDAYRIANTIRAREKSASSFPDFYDEVRKIAGDEKHFTRQELKEGWVKSLNMEQKGSSSVMEDYLHHLWGGAPYKVVQNFLEYGNSIRKKLQDTDVFLKKAQRDIMQERGAMYFDENEELDVYLARSLEVGRRSAMHEQVVGFENPSSDINLIMRRMQELDLQHGDWKKYAKLMDTAIKIEERGGRDSDQYRQQANDAIANDDLQRYLHAVHATERNAYLEQRVQEDIELIQQEIADVEKMPESEERTKALEDLSKELKDAEKRKKRASRGSGLTNEEAQRVLDDIEAEGKTEKLEEVASMVYEMNNKLLDLYEDSGLLDAEFIQELRDRYNNYVPLNRNMADHFGDYSDGYAKGSSGSGRLGEIKKAYGSDREVDHILGNVIFNWERVISDASKNRERNTLADLVDSEWELGNKNLGYTLAEDSKEAQRLSEDQPQSITIPYKKDGENRLIVMPQQAKDIYNAFTGEGILTFNSNAGVRAMRMFMNYLRFVRTSGSMNFMVSNPQRDIGTAVFNMASDFGYKGSGKFLKEYVHGQGKFFNSHRAVWDYVKGKDTDLARQYQELKDLGGTTGFYKLSDRDEIMAQMSDINKKLGRNANFANPVQWGRELISQIDNVNEVMENATRLTAYRTALDRGYSQKKAALYALEITTNFNRQGDWGQIGKVVYQFANSAIQGHARLLKAGRNDPKTFGKTTALIMMAGVLESAWNDGMNEEEYDRLRRTQGWLFDTNLAFIDPEGEFTFKMYLPFGYNVFKTFGNISYDLSIGRITAQEASKIAGNSFLNAFNPFRGSEMFEDAEGLMLALTPSMVEPVLEFALNKSFYGSIYPMYQEEFQEQLGLEDWQVAYENPNVIANKIAKWTARNKDWLNNVIPGSDATISPHTIEHLAQFFGGSMGREWLNAIGKDHVTTVEENEEIAKDFVNRRGIKLYSKADGGVTRLDPNYTIILSRFMRTFNLERVATSNMYSLMGEYAGNEDFKVYDENNKTTQQFDAVIQKLARDYEDFSSSDGFTEEDKRNMGGKINSFVRVAYRRQIEEKVIEEIQEKGFLGDGYEQERELIYRKYNENMIYRIPTFHNKYGFASNGSLVPQKVKNWKPLKNASINRIELEVNP